MRTPSTQPVTLRRAKFGAHEPHVPHVQAQLQAVRRELQLHARIMGLTVQAPSCSPQPTAAPSTPLATKAPLRPPMFAGVRPISARARAAAAAAAAVGAAVAGAGRLRPSVPVASPRSASGHLPPPPLASLDDDLTAPPPIKQRVAAWPPSSALAAHASSSPPDPSTPDSWRLRSRTLDDVAATTDSERSPAESPCPLGASQPPPALVLIPPSRIPRAPRATLPRDSSCAGSSCGLGDIPCLSRLPPPPARTPPPQRHASYASVPPPESLFVQIPRAWVCDPAYHPRFRCAAPSHAGSSTCYDDSDNSSASGDSTSRQPLLLTGDGPSAAAPPVARTRVRISRLRVPRRFRGPPVPPEDTQFEGCHRCEAGGYQALPSRADGSHSGSVAALQGCMPRQCSVLPLPSEVARPEGPHGVYAGCYHALHSRGGGPYRGMGTMKGCLPRRAQRKRGGGRFSLQRSLQPLLCMRAGPRDAAESDLLELAAL